MHTILNMLRLAMYKNALQMMPTAPTHPCMSARCTHALTVDTYDRIGNVEFFSIMVSHIADGRQCEDHVMIMGGPREDYGRTVGGSHVIVSLI